MVSFCWNLYFRATCTHLQCLFIMPVIPYGISKVLPNLTLMSASRTPRACRNLWKGDFLEGWNQSCIYTPALPYLRSSCVFRIFGRSWLLRTHDSLQKTKKRFWMTISEEKYRPWVFTRYETCSTPILDVQDFLLISSVRLIEEENLLIPEEFALALPDE